jgi:hypothetical protein
LSLKCGAGERIQRMLLTAGCSLVGLYPSDYCKIDGLEDWFDALLNFEKSKWHGARSACIAFLAIKKFTSVLNLINRDVMRLIVRRVWRSRGTFVWFEANQAYFSKE